MRDDRERPRAPSMSFSLDEIPDNQNSLGAISALDHYHPSKIEVKAGDADRSVITKGALLSVLENVKRENDAKMALDSEKWKLSLATKIADFASDCQEKNVSDKERGTRLTIRGIIQETVLNHLKNLPECDEKVVERLMIPLGREIARGLIHGNRTACGAKGQWQGPVYNAGASANRRSFFWNGLAALFTRKTYFFNPILPMDKLKNAKEVIQKSMNYVLNRHTPKVQPLPRRLRAP